MWLRILASVALLNFASFIVGHFILGGSAMNGYIKDGRYFLGNHGAFVEVSREVWSYSYYHGNFMWMTQGAVLIGGAIYMNRKRKKPQI